MKMDYPMNPSVRMKKKTLNNASGVQIRRLRRIVIPFIRKRCLFQGPNYVIMEKTRFLRLPPQQRGNKITAIYVNGVQERRLNQVVAVLYLLSCQRKQTILTPAEHNEDCDVRQSSMCDKDKKRLERNIYQREYRAKKKAEKVEVNKSSATPSTRRRSIAWTYNFG